jgi:hypothetical protein
MIAIEQKIRTWFLEHLEQVNQGKLFSLSYLAGELNTNFEELEKAIQRGITIEYQKRKQHVVFTGKNTCSLDTEEIVRTCLRNYLEDQGCLVIGWAGLEFPFRKNLQVLLKVCGKKPEEIMQELKPYLKNNGIDLLAFHGNELHIIEIKGITLEKSDFNETIIQMIKRYNLFQEKLSANEFSKIKFGCGFPYFEPKISKNHYDDKISLLKKMISAKDPTHLYSFKATPNTRSTDGLELIKPFVEDPDDILKKINRQKIQFYFVESQEKVLKLQDMI